MHLNKGVRRHRSGLLPMQHDKDDKDDKHDSKHEVCVLETAPLLETGRNT